MRKRLFIPVILSLILVAAGLTTAAAATDPSGPSAAIASPTYLSVISGERAAVTVLFDAGTETTVDAAELYVDGELHDRVAVSPPTASGSCELTWRCGQFGEGSHKLTARVYDSSGRSSAVDVVVTLKPVPGDESVRRLQVRITAPAEGQEISGQAWVRVATDESRVRYVMLLIDDVFVALTNMPPFSYALDTTRYANGQHALKATAFDLADQPADSPLVNVIINNPGGRTEMRGVTPSGALASQLSPPAVTAAKAVAPEAACAPAVDTITPASPVGPSMATPGGDAGMQVAAVEPAAAPAQMPSDARCTSAVIAAAPPLFAGPMSVSPMPEAVQVAMVPTVSAYEPIASSEVAAAAPAEDAAWTSAAGVQVAALASEMQASLASEPAAAIAAGPSAEPPVQIARAPSSVGVVAATYSERGDVVVHTVRPGEQLGTLSARYQVPAQVIARFNGLAADAELTAGRELRIPWLSGLVLNDEPVYTDVALASVDGIQLAPFRAIVEHSGGVVHWIPANKQVRALAFDHDIWLRMGSREALVDAAQYTLETEARLMRDRAMVPLGLFRDALGFKVTLDPDRGRIYIAAQ